ncbi:uncharacterized protein [Dermacentor albipictus]|uniref:uncharacterized protein isoform X2 n=1 Tax=Dermacentor albipictus TaxID=60249 RepID=UPI0038FD3A26
MSAGQELPMDYYQPAALQGTTLQHGRHRNVSEQSLDIDTSGLRTTTTWFEGQEAPLSSTSLLLGYIKAAKGQRPFSGHGESIGTMHLNNPLLFFIQKELNLTPADKQGGDLVFKCLKDFHGDLVKKRRKP